MAVLNGVLICLNSVILVISVIMLLTTIVVLGWQPNEKDASTEATVLVLQRNRTQLYLSVIVSFALALFSFFGCFGIILGNKIFIMIYLLTASVLIICMSVILVWKIMSSIDFHQRFKEEMMVNLKTYGKDEDIKKIVNSIQLKYECCGIDSYEDWVRSVNYIPGSCCNKTSGTCTTQEVKDKHGCYDQFKMAFSGLNITIGQTVFCLILLILLTGTTIYVTQEDRLN